MKIGELRYFLLLWGFRGMLSDSFEMVYYCRGKFNPEMMGEEIDENTRSIFPVELDDDIVLADTKEWVQRGDNYFLNPMNGSLTYDRHHLRRIACLD